jgi:flagellar hook-associated protein 2
VTSSIDGLVSGLSTSSLISQLMQVESLPQSRLKTKVSDEQKTVTAYQSVNTKLAALKTAADNLGQLSTWRAVKATASSNAVTATAAGGVNTITGSVTFNVVSLARAQISTAQVASTGDITTGGSISVTVGTAAPVAVDISLDRTAKGVVEAINAKGLGVKASLVTTSTGTSVLQLTAAKTGTAGAFSVTGFDPVLQTPVSALDAKIEVGDPAAGGYAVTSSSNTFTGLISGVTLTANKVENNVTVDVTADAGGMAGKMQALVDAANGALSDIAAQTKYDAANKTASVLTGDFMVRQLGGDILSTISNGLTGYGSLSQFGVQLDRGGKLTFDAEKFKAAYAADPEKIKTVGIQFADNVEALATKQQENVTAAITGRKSLIDSLTKQVENWDFRLAGRKEALQRQFTNLETTLSKMKSQSTWLAGQLSSLG